MKLNKYTWNNGTQSSPIILTNDQIKKLIAIGQREDIESNVSGYITTPSRKIQKLLKHMIESQFKDLNIIYDEELADTFNISIATNTIKEGTRELISINTDSGINHSFLKWKYDYSDFVIDGDISEQNIKDRIRVENGYLIVDEPRENASWSVQLTLTAYPSYYSEEEFNSIPTSDKSDIILTIIAKKIEDISISIDSDATVNSQVKVSVSPVPTDSTKLKGANYTYSTNTPDILTINTSTQGTTILTKKEGTANLTVTLHACNNTVTKANSITFEVYGLRPVVFIIDQRYISGLSDPVGMVSKNYILNSKGTLISISNNGATGNPDNNTLTWLRQNTHAYVSRNLGPQGVRLKQLSDTSRKIFADGTSAADYISNENGEFDVFLKFGSDIYYKTEAWIPEGQEEPDPDYVAVTIARKLPSNEDASKWCKWSQYRLIGVYPSYAINEKLYSLSGKLPNIKLPQINSIKYAKARGTNFNICDYAMTKLFAFLFYGYYGTLGSQQMCGYGTNNNISGTYYPKITGSTDELNMTDTDSTNGNGASSPNEDQIKAGIGSDIKTVNFWGLESCWGDGTEYLSDLKTMFASRPSNITGRYPEVYVADYLDEHDSVVITKTTGIDVTYTSKDEFIKDYPEPELMFVSISDNNSNIIRIIATDKKRYLSSGYIKKMIFGAHADIMPKDYNDYSGTDIGFTDYFGVESDHRSYRIGCRSSNSNDSSGGVGYISVSISHTSVYNIYYSRLLYNGTERTVHIIDDATEEL